MYNLNSSSKKSSNFPRPIGLCITNTITLIRFLGIFPIITSFLSGNMIMTGWLAGMVGITDKLDGWSATYLNGASKFGALFDACTDKIFAMTLNLLLVSLNPLFLLNLIGECMIGGLNAYYFIFKKYRNQSTMLGKVKTVTLFAEYVLSFLLLESSLEFLIPMMILGNFGFQQVVFVNYYKKAQDKLNITIPLNPNEMKEKENTPHELNLNKEYQPLYELQSKKQELFTMKQQLQETQEINLKHSKIKVKKKIL